uniref:G-protein coupled receptors family 1 profile domain-containing protein n=1 Tax=Latimeria chalumnae TaxID=7897 RepID=H3A0T5_LATCH
MKPNMYNTTPSSLVTIYNETGLSENSTCHQLQLSHKTILLVIYSTILIGGTLGVILMSFCLLKSHSRSTSTIVVINLVATHSVFLVTIPFRISYYVQNQWNYGFFFCKVSSSMVHIHMYLSFLFYVVLLATKYLTFLTIYRKPYVVAASVLIWVVVILIVFPTYFSNYGSSERYAHGRCFQFQRELKRKSVIIINYMASSCMIVVICTLVACQGVILAKVIKTHSGSLSAHLEFGAQKTPLTFLLIMLVCFLPYQLFRIHYVKNIDADCSATLSPYNEILLAFTGGSTLDSLLF